MQLTGLTAGRNGRLQARQSLMLHLDEAPAGAFARVTRLTATEASRLCMSSMSGRYPWAAPQVTADQWGPRALASPWVFTSATRYCPQCLAGDGSPIQQQHGGAWQKAWRLPVVFACRAHRRLLEHLCPVLPAAGHVRGTRSARPADPARRRRRPAPRPVPGGPQAAGRRPGTPAPAGPGSTHLRGPERIPRLPMTCSPCRTGCSSCCEPEGPAAVMSVGHPATPAQYFADLRLVCSLINGAWPHSRNLITGPGMAESLDQYITSTGGTAPRRHTLCDTPPLDARPGAALIAAAARILDGGDLRVLGELLTPARDGASRKTPRGRWIRRYQRAGHDCSDGFRDALEPLVNSFQRTDRRITRTPGTRPADQLRSRAHPRAPARRLVPRALPPHRREHPAAPPRRRPPPGPDIRRRLARRGRRLPRHRPPLPQGIPRLSSVHRRPGRLPPRGARARPAAQRHPRPDQLQAPQGRPPGLVHRPRNMAGHHQPAPPDKRTVPARAQRLQAPVRLRGRLGARHPGRAPPGTPDHREPAVSRRPHLAPAPRQHVALLQRQPGQTALRRPQEDPQRPRQTTSPQPSTRAHQRRAS